MADWNNIFKRFDLQKLKILIAISASRSSFNRHNRLPEKSEADALPKSRVIKNWDAKLTHNLPKPDVNEVRKHDTSLKNNSATQIFNRLIRIRTES